MAHISYGTLTTGTDRKAELRTNSRAHTCANRCAPLHSHQPVRMRNVHVDTNARKTRGKTHVFPHGPAYACLGISAIISGEVVLFD